MIAQKALPAGEPLPQVLGEWVADVLSGDRPRPTKGAEGMSYRNFLFCLAIRHLKNTFDLTPTSNSASDAWSGCDVVAKAAGYNVKTVEAAWGKRGPFFRSSET